MSKLQNRLVVVLLSLMIATSLIFTLTAIMFALREPPLERLMPEMRP